MSGKIDIESFKYDRWRNRNNPMIKKFINVEKLKSLDVTKLETMLNHYDKENFAATYEKGRATERI